MSQPHADVGRQQLRRTTFEWWQAGEEYRATEPGADSETVGCGENPRAAVVDYCQRLEARDDE